MVPFNDLRPLDDALAEELYAAARRVLASGWYVLGPEVEAFESEWAACLGIEYAIGVANGTDAVELALRAAGIGPGDEVITVSHTAVATVCAIERAGAKPVLVDIAADSFAINTQLIGGAIGPRTKAIVPVHLYGHPAAMSEIVGIAERHGLLVIEDCAQAHGATWQGKIVGTFGHLACFSFYPTKNLAACGDAGAVVTADSRLARRVRELRSYGQKTRGRALERGINSRLDELQAALLRVRLQHLAAHNTERRHLAASYSANLSHLVRTPIEDSRAKHVYHLYVIRHPEREMLQRALKEAGVETLIHYPMPVHLQPAYTDLGYGLGSLPRTEQACREILSLPLFVGMTDEQVLAVTGAVREALVGVGS